VCRIVLPTTDLLFKKLLSNPEYPEILQGFLADVFNLWVELDRIQIKTP